MYFPFLQLKWPVMPVCYHPEALRGVSISILMADDLDSCYEKIADEGHDAASTSHNFLEQGKIS